MTQPTGEILSVSALNREVKYLLEGSFPSIWVEGEISNFLAHTSGHWYFSLKDQTAAVKGAMFKSRNKAITFIPKNGMQVMVKANVSLYEGRGDYQLIVEHMEEAGLGKLRLAFEALKKKLSEAGLFDPGHKKTLPTLPTCIGIITSPTGAAIKDILNVLKRRLASIPVIIYPTLVQGDLAAPQIVNAIQTATQRQECDVLILARGGGSLEDLWPFNEEIVARAIYDCDIPIVTGIGHEIDFTIADFVADTRAPTPSAAAELVTPDRDELLTLLQRDYQRLLQFIKNTLTHTEQHLTWAFKHLQQQHPKRRLLERMQQLDLMQLALETKLSDRLNALHLHLHQAQNQILHMNPLHKIHQDHAQLDAYQHTLHTLIARSMQEKQVDIASLAASLDALSPLATLQRGYAITTRLKDNAVVSNARQLEPGERIGVKLHEGRLECTVEETYH